LIIIFLLVKVIPLILLTVIAWFQFIVLGDVLREIAVSDSTSSLNESAVKNIERISTDAAMRVAEFLYGRDDDLLYVAKMNPTEENFAAFLNAKRKRVVKSGRWELAPDGKSWIDAEKSVPMGAGVSTNPENNDLDSFHPVPRNDFQYDDIPIYDEITFVGLDGRETIKMVAADSPKRNFPLSRDRRDVSKRENTYVGAETYFPKLAGLRLGEIYVSDVVGAYVGSNYIGMYTPDIVAKAAEDRGYPIAYEPEKQAYSGAENPVGRRFEGIVRWATPVAGPDGGITGYVTLALNHDHIMEFVDHITPLDERYTKLPSAYEGNYAFIWDYKCRSICHPRHHSIVGFDPDTGDPQTPWLETSIYQGWKNSGLEKWTDYVKDKPVFHEQSRSKKPAPELTRAGLVGLDGRYLDNAPQCTGWMDLTRDGGSGSFYILWSGLYKLNTAAAIPYYTGQYAPSADNGNSRRGFGFVAIGSELDYFTRPAKATEARLRASIDENLGETVSRLIVTTLILTAVVLVIAVWMAWHISHPIKSMAGNMARLAIGDVGDADEVSRFARRRRDEIGLFARSLHDLILSRRDEIAIADSIAGGDYTRSVQLRSESDLLGRALNAMIRVNKRALSQVNLVVEQVGDGAKAVSGVSVSLAHGVETSEAVLKQISETVGVVDRQVHENAGHARGANQLASASRDAADRGYAAVVELAGAMSQIQQAGKKIVLVAKLIDDIAFQTNLLALNAAVEAARAGRQGKGFSVVADEVRNLSARSAKAAHETEEMVESMVSLMETGAKLAGNSDREFQEIVKTTAQVAQLFHSIAEASDAQSASMSSIVQSLGQIKAVTQENSDNARRMSSSAGTLSRQAEELRHMLSHFRLASDSGDPGA
ncbi:MAG: methyl-accepting chemotaxis protein, partial [Planctomycetota bacterium]|nr:methyl-accepting chemotaxis protein [Planctomycetota bacterium]